MSKKTNVAGTPADPTVRYTPLTLGPKTYQLAYDFDALARAEEMTGLSLLVGVNWSHIGAKQIRATGQSHLEIQPWNRRVADRIAGLPRGDLLRGIRRLDSA